MGEFHIKLKERIRSSPTQFWLIEVQGQAASQATASALHATGDKVE